MDDWNQFANGWRTNFTLKDELMETYIKAIAYYLPEKVLTNEQLVKEFPEWSVEKVAKKVGVYQRHLADEQETAGDMAAKAAEKLFAENNIDPKTIDFILLCTQSPDYRLPTTACLLQDRLGLPTSCGALDFNLGCSGYIYGLSLAKGLIASGTAKNVLLLTCETYSKYIHPQDKGNRSIFGDGASATLVSTEGLAKIGNFVLGTDGKGADNLIVRNGGARPAVAVAEDIPNPDYLYMNGSAIFNFTLEAVPPLIAATLEKNSLQMDGIDKFVFHQANKFMLDTIRKVAGISKDKFYVNLENVGNTVSSTIPIALKQCLQNGELPENGNVLIAGFGVGYSWGACVLNF